MKNGKPLVSVLCLTYNQEKYIAQALDGFLMQETDFPYEIIIHDDASTDATQSILKEYEKKHPELIKTIIQKENQFSKGNRNFFPRFLFPRAKGKYFALCEGDDYWTDSKKLQTQIDFLEKNSDFTICFHPVEVVYENNEVPPSIFPDRNDGFTVERLLERNFIQTNSVVYRRLDFTEWAYDVVPGDWYLHLVHARFGKIGFIDRVMATYRRHPGGLWWDTHSNPDQIWQKYGLGHLALFSEVLRMYSDSKEVRSLANKKIGMLMDRLHTLDGQGIYLTAVKLYPKFLSLHIQELHRELNLNEEEMSLLKHKVDKTETALINAQEEIIRASDAIKERNQQIFRILNSRSWKVASFIHKVSSWLSLSRSSN